MLIFEIIANEKIFGYKHFDVKVVFVALIVGEIQARFVTFSKYYVTTIIISIIFLSFFNTK